MNALTFRSTPHQRLAIRCELQLQELPTDSITLLHERAFKSAGLPVPTHGTDVDSALCELSKTQASRLIDALRGGGRS